MNLTHERASELLNYDPQTGSLTWKVTRGGHVIKGKRAGCQRSDGYWVVRLDGVLHLSHRVAWLLMKREWPLCEVDHISGDPGDMRWGNLREANHSQNITNQKIHKDKKLRHKGVYQHKNGRYYVRVKNKSCGSYPTLAAAISAYWINAKNEYGEFARQ